jgi:predicted TIM-barrel fold metal-dependent hydrolase
VLALLRAGIFDELPGLTLIIPMIAAAALIFAAQGDPARSREEGWRGEPPAQSRRRLYVDTMGFDPAALRWVAGLLGPERVLLGSDWPIMPITPPADARAALAEAGLSEAEQDLVMAGNALRLLGRGRQEGTA